MDGQLWIMTDTPSQPPNILNQAASNKHLLCINEVLGTMLLCLRCCDYHIKSLFTVSLNLNQQWLQTSVCIQLNWEICSLCFHPRLNMRNIFLWNSFKSLPSIFTLKCTLYPIPIPDFNLLLFARILPYPSPLSVLLHPPKRMYRWS